MGLSLRARFTLGLGVLAFTVLVVASVAVVSLTRLGGAVATILRENYASVLACEDMKEALERQDSAAIFASAGHQGDARAMLATYRASFLNAFEREAHNVTLSGEGEAVREIAAQYEAYVRAVDQEIAAPPDRQREVYFSDLLPRFTRLKEVIQRVLRMNQANMEAADRSAKAVARQSARITLAVSGVALLLAFAFAAWLPRAIGRPVEALTAATQAVGEGNLGVAIPVPEVRDLVPLAAAFGRMVAQLRAYRDSSLGELLAAKDLARATVECLLDPVVVLGEGGEVLLTNESAEQAFGLRPGTPEELRDADVVVPPDFVAACARVFSTGAPVQPPNLSEAMRWRSGDSERYYLVRASPLRTDAGERSRAIVVAQEVTRLRRIDELKSDMVSTVSHEFKTPLTSLRMVTHLLLEPATGPLTDTQRDLTTMARDDTERLRALVDDLLDLVRIEAEAGALRRASLDARALLREVAEAHRGLAREKGVTLEVAVDSEALTFSGDAEKLAIVLANLVSNAIRHTPTGGRVALSATRDQSSVQLVVRDTGEGISAAELSRIFERSRVGPGGTGSRDRHGLGLSIAREIVLQHGGELRARSEPGHGSRFEATLPVAKA